jgi:hypothetical protein
MTVQIHTVVFWIMMPCCINPYINIKKNQNSVALVRERTIPTERPPLVGEVSANCCRQRGVTWSVWQIPYGLNLGFSRPVYKHQHDDITQKARRQIIVDIWIIGICSNSHKICTHYYNWFSIQTFLWPRWSI